MAESADSWRIELKRVLFGSLALIVAATASTQVDTNRVVATIDGQDIKGGEFYRRMEFLPGFGRMIGNRFVEYTPGMWALEQIITEKLILGLAKEKGLLPTEAEVQAEMRIRLDSNPKILQDWESTGQTRAELENQVRVQICQFKLATNGVTVTDQEVDKFYKDNPFSFTVPKRVKLRVISTSDPVKKQQVDTQLAGGVAFDKVAEQFSEDISRAAGGDFGTIPLNSMAEVARKAIERVKIGQTTEWITSGDQNIKFKVENVLPEQLQPLDAKLRKSIRTKLMLDRGKNKNDLAKQMEAYRAKAKISVKDPFMASEWQRMQKQFGNTAGSKP